MTNVSKTEVLIRVEEELLSVSVITLVRVSWIVLFCNEIVGYETQVP